jgi:putative peptide zinc metalloprotease protein
MLALRPTFSESWYRVANLRVRLRPGAQISRQFHRGERWYVVRDPAGNQYHRLSDAAYRFVGLLDGHRTVSEAWDLVGGQLDDAAPTQPEVIQILSQLHAANLIEADITPDADVLLRRYKSMRRRQLQGRLMNFLFPRIPLWDPDRFCKRWMPLAKVFLSTGGTILWFAVVIGAIIRLAPSWDALKNGATEAMNPNNWLYLWATFVVTKLLHELGHAFAARRFGGEVHELGIMFLVFIPTPYVDASSAWGFTSKWPKVFVGLAGMYVEIFFAAIMAFVWLSTDPSQPINGLAYNAMLIASVSTVLFNANPLLRYDGYYILSDYLEIPNLRQKSSDYSLGLIKRHIFRIKQQQPLPPVKQRFWLLSYYISSAVYRLFIGLLIIVMVSDRLPVIGPLMAIGGIVTWAAVPMFKLLRYLTIEPELHRKHGRAWAFTAGVVALLFVLLNFVPLPAKVWSEAILEPEHHQLLTMRHDAYVRQVLVKDQAWVKQGDALLVCEDPELEKELRQVEAKLAGSRLQMQMAVGSDPAQQQNFESQIELFERYRRELLDDKAGLTVVAPFDGQFIAPGIQHLQNQYLKKGKELGLVATMDRLEARCPVVQSDTTFFDKIARPDLSSGDANDRVRIRLAGDVGRILNPVGSPLVVPGAQDRIPHASLGAHAGGSIMTDPKDDKGLKPLKPAMEVVLRLDNRSGELRSGQRAYVRFAVGSETIGGWIKRKAQNLIQEQTMGARWT